VSDTAGMDMTQLYEYIEEKLVARVRKDFWEKPEVRTDGRSHEIQNTDGAGPGGRDSRHAQAGGGGRKTKNSPVSGQKGKGGSAGKAMRRNSTGGVPSAGGRASSPIGIGPIASGQHSPDHAIEAQNTQNTSSSSAGSIVQIFLKRPMVLEGID
jgi:hypothetical protein